MNSLLVQISSLTVIIGQSQAIPVPSRSLGEKNAAVFGVLTCIGIGAVIGMCVFCKKKKSQFKKFKNDGNVEEVKSTEYPILKSLNSLDTKKTGAIIPSSPTNLSTDNLLDQSIQYQNESVSSQELDGIENFHLLKYQTKSIQNKSTEPHDCRESMPTGGTSCSGNDDNDSNSNVLLSSKASLSSVSPLPGTKTSCSTEQETASLWNPAECIEGKSMIMNDINTVADELDTAPLATQLEDITISFSEKVSLLEEPVSLAATSRECEILEDVTPMDSLEDNSSIHETNSIEEALRALDIAIDGEAESGDSDSEGPGSSAEYPVNSMKIRTRNEVDRRIELRNEKNSSSDSGMDEIEMSDKNFTPDAVLHEAIRDEATNIVNEVLQMCQKRIDEINKSDKDSEEGDFDNFNKGIIQECSTPFDVRKKAISLDANTVVRQSLLFDFKTNNDAISDASLVLDKLNEDSDTEICQQVCEEENVTGLSLQQSSAFSATCKQEDDELVQIYPINRNVALAPANTTQTIDISASENHKNLPEILIEEMIEGAQPDKSTATPMNTPIELGCPTTADWEHWLSVSATSTSVSSKNIQEKGYDEYFGGQDEGWFLHAQSSFIANQCNETYDMDQNDDNLDSTYDLLRKQLSEMLPHAQGAKESVECLEDNSGSPNSYGIQYGDLDEASNAPSTSAAKENEMIINYKRTLSPIIEESEDESFYNKTSYYKESSNYVESTSTGCMESLTAMGVNKTLMASNDTLFNFEDVLDEILSPRMPSQTHTPTNRDREAPEFFMRSPRHESFAESTSNTTAEIFQAPYSLDLKILQRVDIPDTSLSSPGDHTKVDFSQESTFTLDDQTCVSVSKPNEDDERISEISEPILVSFDEEDSFNEILEKEKPLENEQYNHFLDLRSTAEQTMCLEPPETDENCDPASMICSTGQGTLYLQNKLNIENTHYTNRSLEEHTVIDSIDRFLLKSRNISLPDDKSTNSVVNGHLSSNKISSRSDGKNMCTDYDN